LRNPLRNPMDPIPPPPRLHLLRHAKSSWADPELDDFDRPLAPRGRRAARTMRTHLAEVGIRPALVLCSPARRTRQTLKRVLGALGDPAVRFEASLYEASVHDVVKLLLRVQVDAAEVLVVGHNPWIEELALRLARRPPGGAEDEGVGNSKAL
jgi:phosphohistidine phosphatase